MLVGMRSRTVVLPCVGTVAPRTPVASARAPRPAVVPGPVVFPGACGGCEIGVRPPHARTRHAPRHHDHHRRRRHAEPCLLAGCQLARACLCSGRARVHSPALLHGRCSRAASGRAQGCEGRVQAPRRPMKELARCPLRAASGKRCHAGCHWAGPWELTQRLHCPSITGWPWPVVAAVECGTSDTMPCSPTARASRCNPPL
jgi:hypothetical protein